MVAGSPCCPGVDTTVTAVIEAGDASPLPPSGVSSATPRGLRPTSTVVTTGADRRVDRTYTPLSGSHHILPRLPFGDKATFDGEVNRSLTVAMTVFDPVSSTDTESEFRLILYWVVGRHGEIVWRIAHRDVGDERERLRVEHRCDAARVRAGRHIQPVPSKAPTLTRTRVFTVMPDDAAAPSMTGDIAGIQVHGILARAVRRERDVERRRAEDRPNQRVQSGLMSGDGGGARVVAPTRAPHYRSGISSVVSVACCWPRSNWRDET